MRLHTKKYRTQLRRLTVLALVLGALATVVAAPVSIKARLDSANLLMGNMTTLHLEVVQPKGQPGGLPILATPTPDGIVGLCGDSIELRQAVRRDTTELGSGKIQINYSVPLQAFDSGFYQLPRFVYVSGRDTAYSNQVALKVHPVNVADDAQISDYQGVAEGDSKWTDVLPDWLLDWWWLLIAILILIALIVWGVMRYRTQGSILPKAPEPDPYTVAMAKLRNLKERRLWENGMEKEYFTSLTEILRNYLDKRFGINAMEMTSTQIKDSLYANPEISPSSQYVNKILEMADFVKFAKVRPLPADNIEAYENAVRFVEDTKPQPEEPKGEDKGKEEVKE